jgi:hypothetical protein
MNLGLGHLSELKAHLLNASLRSETTFDNAIAALGKGVAARFARACNRDFQRVVGAEHICDGDQTVVSLPRYPVESISAIALRELGSASYVDQGTPASLVQQLREHSGLVDFGAPLGNLGDLLKITYTGGYWFPTAPGLEMESGTVALTLGGFAAQVVFDSAFSGVPSVRCSVISPEGEAILGASALEITASGFTARLSAATAAAGYSLAWVATYGSDSAEASVLQEATIALAVGDGQKDIAFAQPFAAAPVVVCQVVTPEGGVLISSAPSLVTVSGFRALLSWQIDAAGYALNYLAIAQDAAAAAATLPTGAAALPDDLKLAWLLQCEHIWSLRDKLGVNVAASAKSAADVAGLASMQLLPAVADTLRDYRRYTLT